MKYIDRKGNITIEENEQDKFLRHLYNDRGGRLCLKLPVSNRQGIFLPIFRTKNLEKGQKIC